IGRRLSFNTGNPAGTRAVVLASFKLGAESHGGGGGVARDTSQQRGLLSSAAHSLVKSFRFGRRSAARTSSGVTCVSRSSSAPEFYVIIPRKLDGTLIIELRLRPGGELKLQTDTRPFCSGASGETNPAAQC
ncbi:unnamed protein product, partial [Nesidiocoris tenuis]